VAESVATSHLTGNHVRLLGVVRLGTNRAPEELHEGSPLLLRLGLTSVLPVSSTVPTSSTVPRSSTEVVVVGSWLARGVGPEGSVTHLDVLVLASAIGALALLEVTTRRVLNEVDVVAPVTVAA